MDQIASVAAIATALFTGIAAITGIAGYRATTRVAWRTSYSPYPIVQGGHVRLDIEFVNVGAASATAVELHPSAPMRLIGGSEYEFKARVAPGESLEVTVELPSDLPERARVGPSQVPPFSCLLTWSRPVGGGRRKLRASSLKRTRFGRFRR